MQGQDSQPGRGVDTWWSTSPGVLSTPGEVDTCGLGVDVLDIEPGATTAASLSSSVTKPAAEQSRHRSISMPSTKREGVRGGAVF